MIYSSVLLPLPRAFPLLSPFLPTCASPLLSTHATPRCAMIESNGPKIITALWAMTVISLLFMGLRFFCKAAFAKRVGTDDAILLASWVSVAI